MKENDYMNQGPVMKTADRMLLHYIASAAHYQRTAEEYREDYVTLEHASYYKELRKDWPDIARLYKKLVVAEIGAALILISALNDYGYLSYGDMLNICHILNWFGIPAEDRYD